MSVVYRYQFAENVAVEVIEATLLRTLLTTEYLHGASSVRLDAAHYFDPAQRTCVIDAATPVGADINKLFVGSLQTEFGPDRFSVERVEKRPASKETRQGPAA
jgi:hypothetical protein